MKKLILILLLLVGISYGQKQSLYAQYPNLVFREVFNDEQSTRLNGGVPTAVTYSQGSGVFNGTSSNVNIKGTANRLINFSFRVRFKSTSSTASLIRRENRYAFRLSSGKLWGWIGGGSAIESSGTYNNNQWYDAWYVVGGSTQYLYVNGALINSSACVAGNNSTQDMYIGSYGLAEYMSGSIDYIEIYNRALSASEISNMYLGVHHKDLPSNQAEVLGSELVVDGGFDTDVSWTKDASWTIPSGAGANYSGATNNHTLLQTLNGTISSGKLHKLTFNITSGTARIAFTNDVGTALGGGTGFIVYGVSTNTIYFTADVTTTQMRIYGSNVSGGTAFSIDNVSIKQVLSASTPLLIDFNSTSGSIRDFRGNTITNTATTIKRAGSIWSASFDGSTSKLDFGAIDNLTGDITIVGWVKARSLGEATLGRIIGNTKLVLSMYPAVGSILAFNRDGATTAYSASNSIPFNKNLFVVVTSTSAGVSNIYIGTTTISPALSGTANQSAGTPASGTNIYVGNKGESDRTFNGLIPFLRVYKSILTQAQITQLWSWSLNGGAYVGD